MDFFCLERIRDGNKKICRGCTKPIDVSDPASLDTTEDSMTLAEIMESLTGLKSNIKDSKYFPLILPHILCSTCADLLKTFHQAKSMFIKSAQYFAKQFLDLRGEAGFKLIDDVKEIVSVLGEAAIPTASTPSSIYTAAVKQERLDNISAAVASSTTTKESPIITPLPTRPTSIASVAPGSANSTSIASEAPGSANSTDSCEFVPATPILPPSIEVSPTTKGIKESNDSKEGLLIPTQFVSPHQRPIAPVAPYSSLEDIATSTTVVVAEPSVEWTGPKRCPNCQRVYEQRESLVEHLNAVHPPKFRKCIFCQKKFESLPHLANHIRNVHASILNAGDNTKRRHSSENSGGRRARRQSSISTTYLAEFDDEEQDVEEDDNDEDFDVNDVVDDESDEREIDDDDFIDDEDADDDDDKEVELFECPFCSSSYTSRSSLGRHIFHKHKETTRKRKRSSKSPSPGFRLKRYTAEQHQRLENEFEKDNFISNAKCEELANDINLSVDQIKNWFRNQRVKQRKMQRNRRR